MSLFINCQWFPESEASLGDRMKSVSGLLRNNAVSVLVGQQWYRPGRSRKEALSKPILASQLEQINAWRFTDLSASSGYYGIRLWNGRDNQNGATITCQISIPATRLDIIVIDGLDIDRLQADGLSWDHVLSCARCMAEQLGGLAVVSSHDLIDYAKRNALERPHLAAYGAFWGVDRSGKNPGYGMLIKQKSLPFSMVNFRTWEEVQSPSVTRLQGLVSLLRQ